MTQLPRRAVLAAPAALAAPALAQAYPTRPITMVVPFAAGGPTDTVARLLAQAMGPDLGGTIVVENVAGAGGTLGAQRVAQARPDGYTILCHHIGMATIPTLYRRLAYDPVNGFATIGMITEVPMTIVGRRTLEANTLAELVALVRQRGERLNYANAGIGAASHLCGLLFMSAVGTAMTTVPYRGTGPAMNDLVAGTVDLMC
ncbi:MAG: tripartite tricarboxylate transporter substrate-binding protein, partial [Rhodovarius sp.]|nr:tripartite tricarboxylate transporter substrate-binding protein [Rhodovarius sp.]